jgi:hypothetical protein
VLGEWRARHDRIARRDERPVTGREADPRVDLALEQGPARDEIDAGGGPDRLGLGCRGPSA